MIIDEEYIARFNEILTGCNAIINGTAKQQDQDRLQEMYEAMKYEGNSLFFAILDAYYNGMPQEEILCMSVVFDAVGDGACLEYTEEILVRSHAPYDYCRMISEQLWYIRMKHMSLQVTYEKQREWHRYLCERFAEGMSLPQSKPITQHKDRIVVLTMQLNGDLSSVSRITRDICFTLQEKLGYEVLLVVADEWIVTHEYHSHWWKYSVNNYFEEWGNFEIPYQGAEIKGIHRRVCHKNYEESELLLKEVLAFAPYFVWDIEGRSVFSRLLTRYLPVVSWTTGPTYPISDAPFLLRNSDWDADANAYVHAQGQRSYRMRYHLPEQEKGRRNRAYYDRLEDEFLIVIMGNRLNEELDGELIGVMREISTEFRQVTYLIIGGCDCFAAVDWNGHIINYGFREDYVDIIGIADLFLNPNRIGGGTGALAAIKVGVPVLTMLGGDVANIADDPAFMAESYEEYRKVLRRYLTDASYERKQKDLAKRMGRQIAKTDTTAVVREAVDWVKRQIELSEEG